MKLNPDCIRAVLLELERELVYTENNDGLIERNFITLDELNGLMIRYSKEDIFYSLSNLEQAGHINMLTRWADNAVCLCLIYDLTFQGHEFLDKIRDDQSWSKVKGGAAAIRNYSLDAINAIANGVASAAISAYFEKNPL